MSETAAGSPARTGRSLAGIGLMLGGIFLFSVNDALGKWLVSTYSIGQLLLVRSFAALVVLAPVIWREGLGAFRFAPRPGLQALRVAFATLEVACFYAAVAYLPLADVMTYYLAGPILVVGLSVLFLGERTERRRMAVVGIGFVGVLIALKPSGSTLTWPALIALAGTLFFALLMITTRQLRGTSGTVLVAAQTIGALMVGAVMAPFGWVAPSWLDLGLLALLGVVAMAANVCVNHSLRLAPASVVAPFQYTLIVWAVALGWLVFGDVPGAATLIGAAIIVGAGVLLLLQERGEARS